jgi:hypothetical protein
VYAKELGIPDFILIDTDERAVSTTPASGHGVLVVFNEDIAMTPDARKTHNRRAQTRGGGNGGHSSSVGR